MRNPSRVVMAAITAITVALGLVPAVVLILTVGPGGFVHAWGPSSSLPGALGTTLLSGLIALAVIVVLGGPTAWYLARHVPKRHRTWLIGLILVPLFMPPLVLGLVLAYVLGPDTGVGSLLNGLGVTTTNSWFALVVAQVYEALPYFVMTAWAGLASVPRLIEETAWTLGKSPRQVFWYATLPLAAPSLIVAMAMAWSRVVGAFGAVIILAYHPTGLPVAIWVGLEELGLAQALPLALWLLVVGLPIPLGIALRRDGSEVVLRG